MIRIGLDRGDPSVDRGDNSTPRLPVLPVLGVKRSGHTIFPSAQNLFLTGKRPRSCTSPPDLGRDLAEHCKTHKPMNQIKHVLAAAALCFGTVGVQAQGETAQPMSKAPHNCLTSTTDKDWQTLSLDAAQSEKVKEIQSEWRAAQSTQVKDSKAAMDESPMMDSYEQKVKDVLTAEQYDNWVKWCSTHANKTELKRMEK